MTPPEQVPDQSEHSGDDFKEFKEWSLPDKTSTFKYNPAASDITDQSGKFPETGSYDPPEKD